MKKGKEEFDLCGYCCAWVHDHEGKSPHRVCEDYPKMMGKVLKEGFGVKKRVSEKFVYEACDGCWDKLHETRIEKAADAEAYVEELLSDVWYCSDRWSWDRVLRVQWLYQRLRWRVQRRAEE